MTPSAHRSNRRSKANTIAPLPRVGAHVSAAGGLERAFERGEALGCETIQIFVKSPNQWQGRTIPREEVQRFKNRHAASPIAAVFAHAAYLINLAATDPATLERSRQGLGYELDLCEQLGIEGLVLHPGAHLDRGVETGVAAVAESLDSVLEDRSQFSAKVLLENTAGQGTTLGRTLEELAAIREAVQQPHQIGFCLDTCHAYAGGYAIDRADGYRRFWAAVAKTIGIEAVACLHLNDSRYPRGSRRDRHANLGEGEIGTALFKRCAVDAGLSGKSLILETPVGPQESGHRADLSLLKKAQDGVLKRRRRTVRPGD